MLDRRQYGDRRPFPPVQVDDFPEIRLYDHVAVGQDKRIADAVFKKF